MELSPTHPEAKGWRAGGGWAAAAAHGGGCYTKVPLSSPLRPPRRRLITERRPTIPWVSDPPGRKDEARFQLSTVGVIPWDVIIIGSICLSPQIAIVNALEPVVSVHIIPFVPGHRLFLGWHPWLRHA